MNPPLSGLAARLSRNYSELKEFIQGLIQDHHVSPETIIEFAGGHGRVTEAEKQILRRLIRDDTRPPSHNPGFHG